MKLLRNEDIVYLYLMTSLYAGEQGYVKIGIAKDVEKRAEGTGGKLEMISLPQLRPLTLEIEKASHSLATLKGIKKAKVSKRTGSTEWFCCSVDEAKKIYSKARNLILSSGNLAKAKEINKELKDKIRKNKKLNLLKENEELIMKRTLEGDTQEAKKQMELDL